jgi:hypothetical protein
MIYRPLTLYQFPIRSELVDGSVQLEPANVGSSVARHYSSSMAGSVLRPARSRCSFSSAGVSRVNSTGVNVVSKLPFSSGFMRMFFFYVGKSLR